MNCWKRFAVALLTAALGTTARADLTITEQVHKDGMPPEANMTMTIKIKGEKMRLDLNPQISSIVDLKSGDMTSLMHEQKLAMPIPGASIKGLVNATAQAAAKAENVTPPKPTGRKETISGYACEEYETTSEGMPVYLWLTKDLPGAEKLMSQLAKLASADPLGRIAKDQELPGFPMRTVVDATGTGKTTVTVTAISENPVADADFVVPQSYRLMRIPKIPAE
jgi:hypothetical protein